MKPLIPITLLALLALTPRAALAQAITRTPYLQNGSTTAFSVRWRTDLATDSVVRYGTTADNLNLTATNATVTTEHEVRLTGLSPNTTYFYSVGYGTTTLASGSDYFAVTAPTGAKPTRIWVLGDACTGSTGQAAVRDAYYNFTGTRHTDLWLMLGDNAYSSGLDSEYQSKLFAMYPTMLRKSVLWLTLGNHDGVSADSATQTGPYYNNFTLPKQGEAGGVASGTEAYYSFDYGNIHFVCLESNETNRSATGAMATWLANDLQNNTKDWLIAFFHHPPYTKGSHNSDTETALIEMRQNFGPILEQHGVDLVLCGHSHSYERSKFLDGHYGTSTTFDSATMVVQPGGGQSPTPYTKPALGPVSHAGAVYAVPGSSGQTSGGTLNHPAMYVSLNVLGSMVVDVNNNRLDASFLDNLGAVRDSFTITKGSGANVLPTVSLTSPASGSSFTAPATITLAANAADSDGTVTKVDFFQGTTLLGTDTTSPYSFSWSGAAPGTYSLTAQATDNAGGTRTSSPASVTIIDSASTTVSFQDGVNGYAGTTDTKLKSDAATTNFGAATSLETDGSPDYGVLLRWDLSSIPAGKTITAVSLTFNVTNTSSQIYEFYAMARAWSESSATWQLASTGVPWQTLGANGAADRSSTVLGTLSSGALGTKTVSLNADGIAAVQGWINNPAANFGMILADYVNNADGLDLSSSEAATLSQRPKITITYK